MPRKPVAVKRKLAKDPKYKSELVTRFINSLMMEGKRALAENIFYKAMIIVASRAAKSEGFDTTELKKLDGAEKELRISLALFEKAIENVSPTVEVRSRRVGGATYQVPVEVAPRRKRALAIRWLIAAARKRREKGMVQRLANEIMDAFAKKGGAYEMLERVLKMAKANQAFAHYRWN